MEVTAEDEAEDAIAAEAAGEEEAEAEADADEEADAEEGSFVEIAERDLEEDEADEEGEDEDEAEDESEDEDEAEDESDEEADEEEADSFLESDAEPAAPPPVPAPPQPPAAPGPNPLVKGPNDVPAMAGPALPDVSGKELREAKMKAQRLNRINRRLRRHIRRLKRRVGTCKDGTCPRKMPILVGPEGGRVLNTETRYVRVLGDKERNRKRWSAVDTHPRLLWHPPKLRKAHRFHRRSGRRIAREAKFLRNINRAPLVERRGKWIIKRNYYEDQHQ